MSIALTINEISYILGSPFGISVSPSEIEGRVREERALEKKKPTRAVIFNNIQGAVYEQSAPLRGLFLLPIVVEADSLMRQKGHFRERDIQLLDGNNIPFLFAGKEFLVEEKNIKTFLRKDSAVSVEKAKELVSRVRGPNSNPLIKDAEKDIEIFRISTLNDAGFGIKDISYEFPSLTFDQIEFAISFSKVMINRTGREYPRVLFKKAIKELGLSILFQDKE